MHFGHPVFEGALTILSANSDKKLGLCTYVVNRSVMGL
jgi:hypothetical protein